MADAWQDYFEPGEALLWEGAPEKGLHVTGKMIFMSAFGLPFLIGGLGIFGAGLAHLLSATLTETGFGLFMIAFSLPFSGFGAVMVFGELYTNARAPQKVRYALSTRAAYIASSWRGREIKTYPIIKSSPTGLERGRRADTVWFHVTSERDSDGDTTTTRVGFDRIADGEKVYRMIRQIQSGAPLP